MSPNKQITQSPREGSPVDIKLKQSQTFLILVEILMSGDISDTCINDNFDQMTS